MNQVPGKSYYIDVIKFVLILGVVAWHSNVSFMAVEDTVGKYIVWFLANPVCLVGVVVPVFFIVSGYLYFLNIKKFDFKTYRDKSRRRFFSLVVPYLLWNLIALVLQLIKCRFLGFPSLGLIENGHIVFPRLIEGFWNYSEGYPFAFAFWFIRNLIVVVLVSPLVYLIGGIKQWPFFIFLLIVCVCDTPLFGFEFFVIGCAMASFYSGWLKSLKLTHVMPALLVWIAYGVAMVWVDFGRFGTFMLIVSSFCAFIVTFYFARRYSGVMAGPVGRLLVASTFFLYAMHQLFCTVTRNFYAGIFGVDTSAGVILSFLCTFSTLLTCSFVVWLIMRRIMPAATRVLSGNR